MKRILLIANIRYTITNFRSELLEEMRRMGHVVKIVCPTGKDLDGSFIEEGCVIPLYLERKGINLLQDLKTVFQLFKIFKSEKPDIIMNFTIKPVIYSSIVAGLFTKSKVYSNITGLGYVFTDSSLKARFIRVIVVFLYRAALGFNHKVFFQNPDDLELFIKMGVVKPGQAKRLYGSGINLRKFTPNAGEKKISQSFIFVGRILRDKGIFELIQSMKIVKKVFPNARCFVVGEIDGSNPNSLSQNEVEKLQEEGGIEFLGRIKDVKPYLNKSQVMVLPSYREGTPRSVLEAMACGLPIITTNAPGCRETVKDGVSGFLVPVQNHQLLAQKMIYFLQNPLQIEDMGRASLQRAHDLFDVEKVNKEIMKTMNLL